MSKSNLKKECLPLSEACVYGTKQSDGFVGIRYDKGNIKVFFPFGYSVPESADEKFFRKDILNLVKVLSRFAKKCNEVEKESSIKDESVQLPILAYIHVFRMGERLIGQKRLNECVRKLLVIIRMRAPSISIL